MILIYILPIANANHNIFCLPYVVLHYLSFYIQAADLVIYRETEIAVTVKCVHGRICLNLSAFALCFSGMLIIHIIVTSVVLSSQRNLMAFGTQTIHISSLRSLHSCYPMIN